MVRKFVAPRLAETSRPARSRFALTLASASERGSEVLVGGSRPGLASAAPALRSNRPAVTRVRVERGVYR
jgi:hypothetical protein